MTPPETKHTPTWSVSYASTPLDSESFDEWWVLSDGSTNVKFSTEQDANWFMRMLNERESILNTHDALVKALEGIFKIMKEQKRMNRDYPAGTCNAEDAWKEFSKDEELAWSDARAALAAAKQNR